MQHLSGIMAFMTIVGLTVSVAAPPMAAPPILPEAENPERRPVVLPARQASLDDYLVELAKAGQVNFLADATKFPVTDTPLTAPERKTLIGFIWHLLQEHNVSGMRFDAHTFLFWSKPQEAELARLILVREKERTKEPIPDRNQEWLLFNYLAQGEYGWDAETPNFEKGSRIADLSADLRPEILELVRQYILGEARYWLTDEVWHTAHLRIQAHHAPAEYEELYGKEALYVTALLQGSRKLSRGIGPIGVPAVTQTTAAAPRVIPPQTTPQGSTPPAKAVRGVPSTPAKAMKLETANLDQEPALATAISLEAKRLPLSELLAAVAKKSGVSLKVAAGAAVQGAVFTGYIQDMPLRSLMSTLSRLYGVIWTKSGEQQFTMHDSEHGELYVKLLQRGDLYVPRTMQEARQEIQQRQRAVRGLVQEILNTVGMPALHSREGVPFSALPPLLQSSLRRSMEEGAAGSLIGPYISTFELNQECVLQLVIPDPKVGKTYPDGSHIHSPFISVATPQGRRLTLITFMPLKPLSETLTTPLP